MRDVSEIFDWFVNGAPGGANPVGALEFIGPRFRAMGLNVDHIACFVRTLHPHILGRTLPPVELIAMLNDLFEAQVPAIERNGGEILKFMGDGLLAIWPIDHADPASMRRQCRAALEASREATAALTDLNAAKAAQGGRTLLKFGLALHVGDVAYGNIGGSGRLDFTCIGPAVNIAARLESLTSKLDRPVLVSAEFSNLAQCEVEDVGEFSLKGVSTVQSVFAPVFGTTSVNLKTTL